jgi:hypothetical protein
MTPRRRAWAVGAALACCAAAAAAQAVAPAKMGRPPAAGRYPGQLCVQTGDGPAQCGPAELEFRPGRVRVQVSDIGYRLKLRSSQADVVLMHGAVQIDEFIADYHWEPQSLHFSDADKGVGYEVRWTGRAAKAR